jgi:hypothetical protein
MDMTWLQVTVCVCVSLPNIKTYVGVQHGHDMATGNCLCLSITVPNIKTYVGVQHGHDMATGNCLYFCSLFYNMK